MPGLGAYIISLESNEARAASAARLAASLRRSKQFGDVSIFSAIYWKDRASVFDFLTRHPQHTFADSYLEDHSLGELAVSLSHIGVWRKLLESDHDGAVVFEDDVEVTDMARFKAALAHLREDEAIDWARLHLYKDYREDIIAAGKGRMFIEDPQPWGFAAYYISRAGAMKMLRRCRAIDMPIDRYPPALSAKKVLNTRTATETFILHQQMEDEASGIGHPEDRATPHDVGSSVRPSPKVAEDPEMCRFLSLLNRLEELRRFGVTVLRGVFDAATIEAARERVLAHRGLFKNTRPTPSAGHLAGFHRFPGLEPLHGLLAGNPRIAKLLGLALGGERLITIGLSDVTINRSQPWHVDLLRGKYAKFLKPPIVWGPQGGGVYKALLYLNDSSSLSVMPGSHLKPIPLDSDARAEPDGTAGVSPIPVSAGDVVIMDLRCCHRGADESVYADGKWDAEPRILVSTVFGGAERPLAKAMEVGNFFRLMDWWGRMPEVAPPRPAPAAVRTNA